MEEKLKKLAEKLEELLAEVEELIASLPKDGNIPPGHGGGGISG